MEDNNSTLVQEPPAPANVVANPFAERAAANAAAVAEAKVTRKSLLNLVTTRKRRRPFFGVLYGPPGVGKSTFASEAPNPIFIPCERGLDQISVPRFPIPQTLAEFGSYLKAIQEEPNDYETVIIDTIDSLESPLMVQAVCEEGKVDNLEMYGGGYSKGNLRLRDYWQRLLIRLTALSETKTVLLLAHSHLRTINDPMLSTAYEIHELKVAAKSAEIIRQYVDFIVFGKVSMTVSKDTPKARKGRGIVSSDREMHTQPATGLECKNRYGLPSPMEFSWAALQQGIDQFYGDK